MGTIPHFVNTNYFMLDRIALLLFQDFSGVFVLIFKIAPIGRQGILFFSLHR